jgi:hypothetical protein
MEAERLENLVIECGAKVFNLPPEMCFIFTRNERLTGLYILSYGNPSTEVVVYVDQNEWNRPLHFPEGFTAVVWTPLHDFPIWVTVRHRADKTYDFIGKPLLERFAEKQEDIQKRMYDLVQEMIASDIVQYDLAQYFAHCPLVPLSVKCSYEFNHWIWYWLDPGLEFTKTLIQSALKPASISEEVLESTTDQADDEFPATC